LITEREAAVFGKQATANKHRRRPRRRRHCRASPPQPQADDYPRTSRRAQYSCHLRRFGSPPASTSRTCWNKNETDGPHKHGTHERNTSKPWKKIDEQVSLAPHRIRRRARQARRHRPPRQPVRPQLSPPPAPIGWRRAAPVTYT